MGQISREALEVGFVPLVVPEFSTMTAGGPNKQPTVSTTFFLLAATSAVTTISLAMFVCKTIASNYYIVVAI